MTSSHRDMYCKHPKVIRISMWTGVIVADSFGPLTRFIILHSISVMLTPFFSSPDPRTSIIELRRAIDFYLACIALE